MSRMRMRAGSIALMAAAFAALAAVNPTRANDPDRAARLAVEAPREADPYEPVGTGGDAALRFQFEAFREQVRANMKDLLAGKNHLDVLLESERFMLEADRQCCVTRGERAEAIRLALIRLKKIRKIVDYRVAAGRLTPADLSRVVGQRALLENLLLTEKTR